MGFVNALVTSKARRWLAAALAGAVVLGCQTTAALGDAERCHRDKMRASRLGAATWFHCKSPSDADGQPRPFCVHRAERRVRRLLAVADDRAAAAGFLCPAGGEALGLAGPEPWPIRFLTDAIGEGDERCRREKARAARRYATAFSRCLEEEAPRVDRRAADLEACVRDSRERFRRDWDEAAAAASCGGFDAAQAVDRIEGEIAESASRLEVRCGDGNVGGFEECDDGNVTSDDGCSAECRSEECARVGDDVRCVVCPGGSVPTADHADCRCPDGFEGEPGSCVDIDECADSAGLCPEGRPCVNLQGAWACAIECTAEAFHQALADCGAPTGAIAFDCTDTTIRLPAASTGRLRDVLCNDLTIDGAGRNVAFELDPVCWRTPVEPAQCPEGLEEDGTCACPDLDSGDVFLALRGDGNVVRDLTVHGFFDGIPVRGRDNVVEDVRFERMCDDAFGSVATGVGNVFRRLSVRDGCDKCSENGGSLEDTDPDRRVARHFNAVLSDVDMEGCRTPVRIATAGRYLLRNVTMRQGDSPYPCDGPRFSATGSSTVEVHLEGSTVEGCRRGIRTGRGVDAVIRDSRVAGCDLRGLWVAGGARVSVEGSTFEGNGGGRSSEVGFGGIAVVGDGLLDLGGGELEMEGAPVRSAGQNSMCGNVGPDAIERELDNATATPVTATENWWCSAASPASAILGPALVEPWLTRAPLRMRPASAYITAK